MFIQRYSILVLVLESGPNSFESFWVLDNVGYCNRISEIIIPPKKRGVGLGVNPDVFLAFNKT